MKLYILDINPRGAGLPAVTTRAAVPQEAGMAPEIRMPSGVALLALR